MTVPTVTPMMSQYLAAKEKAPGAILFFRMGDFYEMFFEDAQEASRLMNVALTSRSRQGEDRIPMCGVPHHAATTYISRLLAAGRKVAICEQMEDPKKVKGLVKREIVRVISPGLTLAEADLDERTNNFLAAILPDEGAYGFAACDASTGEFRIGQVAALEDLVDEMARLAPAEVLVPEGTAGSPAVALLAEAVRPRLVNALDAGFFDPAGTRAAMAARFPGGVPDTLPEIEIALAVRAGGAVLEYLRQTQPVESVHLARLAIHRAATHMVLDEATTRNLELFASIADRGKAGTLLWHLDRTTTPMGARMLRRWMLYPLLSVDAIEARLDAVGELVADPIRARALRERLRGVADLERLVGRIALATANGKDLVHLRASLRRVPELREALAACGASLLAGVRDGIDPMDDVTDLIGRAIVDEPPFTVKEGGVIREGFDADLDDLVAISRDGKGWIAALEAKERVRTGIGSLRVRFNKVFGYSIEVTKANLAAVPPDYERRQTLVGAERFVTPALKEYEEKVLTAEERRVELEYDLFTRVRERIAAQAARVQEVAGRIATIDALLALAEVAAEHRYARPVVDASDRLVIREGRHPVVERLLAGEPFVPNDTDLGGDAALVILTGPNMAGKSTYIRQVALIALLAHMGSFVPAAEARLGLVDRIFTRVGASDNLARGQSTFMVEMTETANILRHASPRSLIVLDEIGRGTSTFDGVSIAWAVAEHLHDHPSLGARTLFATHYHELTELALTKPRARNLTVAVKEWNDRILFLRRIVPGGSNRSYGIQVARLAGLPPAVIDRAREILANLERGELDEMGMPRLARRRSNAKRTGGQMHLFGGPGPEEKGDPLRSELDAIDPDTLSPLEALTLVHRWKKDLK
jgi:DNA mismatch repair protein MutS